MTSIPLHQALETDLYTTLQDRVLFFDGDSVITPKQVGTFLTKYGSKQLFVTEVTKDIADFNRLTEAPIEVKEEFRSLDLDWNLPDEWQNLNIREFVFERFEEEYLANKEFFEQNNLVAKYARRIDDELAAYWDLNLNPLLKAVIYTIHTLRINGKVWGVGRGSSVSSYVLYLVGVHDVDSVLFDLDYTDFLRK